MNDIKQILNYIDKHIEERMTLEDVASIAGYSPYYFSREFSEIMGVSLTTFIRVRKFQYAIIDLDNGLSVLDTAIKYGFESHEGFTRSFKKLYGFAPEVIKKKHISYTLPKIIVPKVRRSETMKNENLLFDDMHALFYAICKQSLEEKKQGFCENITVTLKEDNVIEIFDDGRGIPLCKDVVGSNEKLNSIFASTSTTPIVYNSIDDFASAELNQICCLAEKFEVSVYRGGIKYTQNYVRGIPTHELLVENSEIEHGMRVLMKPDTRIFGRLKWDVNKLKTLSGIKIN